MDLIFDSYGQLALTVVGHAMQIIGIGLNLFHFEFYQRQIALSCEYFFFFIQIINVSCEILDMVVKLHLFVFPINFIFEELKFIF